MDQILTLPYQTDNKCVYDIVDVNSSFAIGRLKIMYTGKNPNGSFISRDAVERALPSLYNVPIVAHYDRDDNTIGSHDVELRKDDKGELRLSQLTEPCGVVPESATFSFVEEEDVNGDAHEYLVANGVLLWKRQDVFQHIKEDLGGSVKHSMEIAVKSGFTDENKTFVIESFQFTALCLLETARPCFEGSELTLYSAANFKQKMEEMMAELKETYTHTASTHEVDIDDISTKGGERSLDMEKLLAEFNLTEDEIDFSTEGMTEDEIRAKLQAIAEQKFDGDPEPDEPGDSQDDDNTDDDAGDDDSDDDDEEDEEQDATDADDGDDDTAKKKFGLTLDQFRKELCDAICEQRHPSRYDPDYMIPDYWYVDCDVEAGEVYVQSTEDGKFYGFAFSRNGDGIKIDWESKTRKKISFVDFDEGEPDDFNGSAAEVFESVVKELYSKIKELAEFKADVEKKRFDASVNAVFAKFTELEGNERFEELKKSHDGMTVDEIEDKCFAIKGRMSKLQFSAEETEKVIIPVEQTSSDEPYGGLCKKYLN